MEDIVTWSATAKHVEGQVWNISISADIAEGYHIYDMTEHPYGTTPTVIVFKENQDFSTLGQMEIVSKVDTRYEDVLGFEVGTLSGTAQFSQDVELNADAADAQIKVEWMACTDSQCTPPDFTVLNVHLGVPAVAGEITVKDDSGNHYLEIAACAAFCIVMVAALYFHKKKTVKKAAK